jgi:hypothetical protein
MATMRSLASDEEVVSIIVRLIVVFRMCVIADRDRVEKYFSGWEEGRDRRP